MKTSGKGWAKFKQFIPLYLMMIPGAAYLIINNYIPMTGIVIAFKKYNVNDGIYGSPWAGLENFEFLLGSRDAFIIIRNTLLYNVAFIVVNMVVAIMLAIFITDVVNQKMRKIYQSSILFPYLISIVVVSYIVFALLSHENGMINKSIIPLFGGEPVLWYNETKYWPLILIITNCWKGVGYSTLIYIAGIAGIDPSYYEAAELDGASKWQQIRFITVPLLAPTTFFVFVTSIISSFQVFDAVSMMTDGGPGRSSSVLVHYLYQNAFKYFQLGYASAIAYLMFFIVMALTILNMKFSKGSTEGFY